MFDSSAFLVRCIYILYACNRRNDRTFHPRYFIRRENETSDDSHARVASTDRFCSTLTAPTPFISVLVFFDENSSRYVRSFASRYSSRCRSFNVDERKGLIGILANFCFPLIRFNGYTHRNEVTSKPGKIQDALS